MKCYEWKTALAAAAAAIGIAAPACTPAAETPTPEFSTLDVNRDGFVSRAEASKIPDFDYAFDEGDDNRDGRLDAAEFLKAQAVHERERAGRFVQDSLITTRVKAAFLKDPVVKGTAVSVETHRGTVKLSGVVESRQQV